MAQTSLLDASSKSHYKIRDVIAFPPFFTCLHFTRQVKNIELCLYGFQHVLPGPRQMKQLVLTKGPALPTDGSFFRIPSIILPHISSVKVILVCVVWLL